MDTEKIDIRYIQFPLSLLRQIHTNRKETLNAMLTYGIVRYASKFNVKNRDVARQIIYENYRGNLGTEIKLTIAKLNLTYFGFDSDFNGFAGDTFCPDDELDELEQVLNVNPHLCQLCMRFYQVHLALSALNLTGDKAGIIEKARAIEARKEPGEPMPMVNVSVFLDFRDNEKTESDWMQWIAFIAIRSILGKKLYCKTNKQYIVTRMFGYATKKQLEDNIDAPNKPIYLKYKKRYHIDKLLIQLQLNWGLHIYSHRMRGLYIANSHSISLEKLAIVAEQAKKSSQLAELNRKKAEASKAAIRFVRGKK